MRADDVLKHSEFESSCTSNLSDRHEEERMCDHLISAARRRDAVLAGGVLQIFLRFTFSLLLYISHWTFLSGRLVDKLGSILSHPHGAWSSQVRHNRSKNDSDDTFHPQASPGSMVSVASSCDSIPTREPVPSLPTRELPTNFWKLDVWEDDARRRKRFFSSLYEHMHPFLETPYTYWLSCLDMWRSACWQGCWDKPSSSLTYPCPLSLNANLISFSKTKTVHFIRLCAY